jgi:Tfp pilus assembly protein PilP
LGPRFEDLALHGVIHSTDGRSVALLSDGGGRIYRVRRGEVVGNARVISISSMKVVFAVENFGVVRQEELELKRKDNEGGQP